MKSIMKLVSRNMKVYFRDKTSVFFSFLSIIIIIALYALFLGEIQVNSIKNAAGDVDGARFLVDTWIMAGILAVSTITISLGALGTMVDDRYKDIIKDFMVSPLKRSSIVASYILSTWIISLIVSTFTLIIAEGYILVSGGEILSVINFFKVYGILVLSIFSSSSIMFFIASFIKTTNSFATLSTIVGTMIGFLAGIYVPMGILPQFIHVVIKSVPISHGAALLRQILTQPAMNKVFAGAPQEAITAYKEFNGIIFKAGDGYIEPYVMLIILAGSGLLFFALSVIRASKIKI